jgi:Hypervirulence associated proteins TUDOR domain
MAIRTGTTVTWRWGNGTAEGKVVEIHHEPVTRTLSGSDITRNGSDDDPALLIEQENGARVLKLRSEVERA